ncbi:MAG: rhodanese-like domain-containing protein [Anaerolineae bacterium]|nr:rhodanese-like domain-containing protein [Anaerolineae bacterium]
MARKAIYKVLGVLGIVVVFVVGVWLGRLYSAAGGPGAVTLQQFRSTVVRQIRQLWEPPTPPRVPDSGSAVPRISLEQLKEKLDAGVDIVIVDVRSKEDFDEGRITEAMSIPWEEMEARYTELPRDKEIITYCGRC